MVLLLSKVLLLLTGARERARLKPMEERSGPWAHRATRCARSAFSGAPGATGMSIGGGGPVCEAPATASLSAWPLPMELASVPLACE